MINSIKIQFENSRTSVFLVTAALVSIVWSVIFSVITIAMPYQIEFREGTAQVITRILLSRGNPFTFENHPLAMNNYGFGYNLAVLPFAALFGNTLSVHRAVTFAAILLSAVIAAASVYKTARNFPFALTLAAFVTVGLVGKSGIGAFPSALGTFLFLVAVLIPLLRSYDTVSLIVSALFSLAAFYTKPYFVLAFGVVVSFVFLFVSIKKAIGYALAFLSLLAASFFFVREFFPLYFFDVFISNMSMSSMSYPHLWQQLKVLFFFFLPILALSLFGIFVEWRGQKTAARWKIPAVNFLDWRRPFLDFPFDYYLYLFIIAFSAFVLVLGLHTGNYMTYAYQLVVPTFLGWFFNKFGAKKINIIFVAVILLNLFLWQGNLLAPYKLEQRNSKEWERFFGYLQNSTNVLNSPVDASEITRLGLTPIESGQTMIFYLTKPFEDTPLVQASYANFINDGYKYTKLIDRTIENRYFDLVVQVKNKSVFYNGGLLDEHYALVDEIELDMPQAGQHWTVYIWKPKQE